VARRIAANAVADRRKRAGREIGSASPPEQRVDPDADLGEVERYAQLFRLVDELPGDQRRVIVERYVEERSIREIAARLDRSEGAIKQLQLRALQTLRARMEAAHA
jgi:RNA polymerase sigma-70 factor (ECF subfamily)